MSVSFNLATRADLPAIVAIYNQAIPGRLATADLQPVTVADREEWFAAHNQTSRPLWQIMVNQQLAGWISLESFYGRAAYDKTAEISIYIANDFQHQGLGQQALDFVIPELSALNINALVAFIFAHNTPSLALFKKNGFAEWGHLPDVAVLDNQTRSLNILGRRF